MSTRSTDSNTASVSARFRLRERRMLCVTCVNNDNLRIPYDKKSTIDDIFREVCSSWDIKDGTMFGLAIKINGFYHFLKPQTRVFKVNFKSIRKKNEDSVTLKQKELKPLAGSSSSGQENVVDQVFFRVKFYVKVNALPEKSAKKYYYLQLRENFLNYNLVLSESTVFQLIILSLQTDFGSYTACKSKEDYFPVRKYCPGWLIDRYGDEWLSTHLPSQHASLELMSQSEALFKFIRLASEPPASSHSQHLFKVVEKGPSVETSLYLGLGPLGLSLFELRNFIHDFKVHTSTLHWSDIMRLNNQHKRFEIVPKGSNVRSLFLYMSSSAESEHLMWLSKEMHRFQLVSQMFAHTSSKALEEHELRLHHESYIYSPDSSADTAKAYTSLPPRSTLLITSPTALGASHSFQEDDFRPDQLLHRRETPTTSTPVASPVTKQLTSTSVTKQPLNNNNISASMPLLPEVQELKQRLGCSTDLTCSLPLLTGLLSSSETNVSVARHQVQRHHSDIEGTHSASTHLWRSEALKLNEITSSTTSIPEEGGPLQFQHRRYHNYLNVGKEREVISKA